MEDKLSRLPIEKLQSKLKYLTNDIPHDRNKLIRSILIHNIDVDAWKRKLSILYKQLSDPLKIIINDIIKNNITEFVYEYKKQHTYDEMQAIFLSLLFNTSIIHLTFTNHVLFPGVQMFFVDILKDVLIVSNTIKYLTIDRFDFDVHEIKYLTDGLSYNISVRHLALNGNVIKPKEIVYIMLSNFISKNNTITHFTISESYIREWNYIFKALINNTSIIYLNISKNTFFYNKHLVGLGYLLLHNTIIEQLYLSHLSMDDVGFKHISQSLEHNKTLNILDVEYNLITDGRLVTNLLAVNNTITDIFISYNHLRNLENIGDALSNNITITSLNIEGNDNISQQEKEQVESYVDRNKMIYIVNYKSLIHMLLELL